MSTLRPLQEGTLASPADSLTRVSRPSGRVDSAPGRATVARLLASAGVELDGNRPSDPRVHDPSVYPRWLSEGALALGETYTDGAWDCEALDDMLARLLGAGLDRTVIGWSERWDALRARLLNPQAGRRALAVGERHYDLGNDLYRAMLGKRLIYSCAYWRDATDLDAAQVAKLDLIARKLQLAPGMRVLDIGCGWGEALRYFAEHFGVNGVGLTISREQAAFARDLCHGLPIEIRVQDYRDVRGEFDRVFSVGMFEHVGVRNYRAYFETVHRCLPRHGLSLLHTIGTRLSTDRTDPWIARYIFPNSMLPSAAQIAQASEGLFVLEDCHNFGADYDRTLRAWRDNIERAWDDLPARYDRRFRRMWRYYLHASMGAFRSRQAQLWQFVLSSDGVPGGYVSAR
ncbi:cyclopropane fatty acyl phospholipid synthase [Cognatilysobacter lacus]|uniref:Cyclopropane fatty acyl phospholipid synthase n=1 Tax=Cognatilysobacter lacus TaxID=1643323 RepID=A0A5D8Z4F7_9GAMM|nr:cyclopropane fatty acyl phospholipid synthase [Lysobacter lacus]TZF89808.1 cyclopropane fatty acyl phospholipid synthase [Lysobacter lacus]